MQRKKSQVKNRQDSTELSPDFRNFPLESYSRVYRSTRTLYRTRGRLRTNNLRTREDWLKGTRRSTAVNWLDIGLWRSSKMISSESELKSLGINQLQDQGSSQNWFLKVFRSIWHISMGTDILIGDTELPGEEPRHPQSHAQNLQESMWKGKADLEILKGMCSEQESEGRERLALGCPEKSNLVLSAQTFYSFYPKPCFYVTFSLGSMNLTLLQRYKQRERVIYNF